MLLVHSSVLDTPLITMINPWTSFFFFFNDPAPTEISPLPLHDALPISGGARRSNGARLPRRSTDSAASSVGVLPFGRGHGRTRCVSTRSAADNFGHRLGMRRWDLVQIGRAHV